MGISLEGGSDIGIIIVVVVGIIGLIVGDV